MLKFLRIVIVLFVCFVMWFRPNSTIDFFRSLIILVMGYGYDYSSVLLSGRIQKDLYQIRLGAIGTAISILFFIVGLAGLSGGLIMQFETNSEASSITIMNSELLMMDISFPMEWLLKALVIYPILAGAEFWGEFRENGGD